MQLFRHIPVFYDGAGDELGEHDHIGAEIDDVVFGGNIPAVDVDGIAHGLEGVEADAQRQYADPFQVRQAQTGNGVVGVHDEVGVFEHHQHGQTAHNG